MTSCPSIRRGYVDGRFGQVHFWQTDMPEDAGIAETPLYCLHATAYSGQTFLPLMERMRDNRRVVALDTPGYGSSDSPPTEIDISEYADTIAEAIVAIESLHPRGAPAVDLFGYHTGAMIAAELAVLHPDLVNKLVMIGIPFFNEANKADWRQKLVHVTELSESFEQFRARWEYFITKRTPGLTLRRAFDCFVDELRAYPRDWWAHKALFDYLPEQRLPLVRTPVRVINIAGALAQCSREAAALMPDATVVDLPQVHGAPFDLAPGLLADEIEVFLQARETRPTAR